ncbi:restriction endonuclease [Burkholderia sp. MS389]|uniref:type II restriction endonuclease n=1 Tax=Burkholderia sp. MS389 TaxID=2811789 RepID=UPI00195D6CBC|nr:type II restriction endonuclease [Burkholderia sp. MS389]QRR11912.1 restriction endonuclease [Burkholderia sp. MS389]
MKRGHLSEYFVGVAIKRLSAVEADVLTSNQHEFNGVESLKRIFGQAAGKQTFPARFVYLSDDDDNPVVADGFLTWYDARERHPTRSEHRLYFPTTTVSQCAAAGDLLVIARKPDGSALVVVAEDGSTIANQICWLFGADDLEHPGFSVRSELETEQDRIQFASRFILEQIGIVVEVTEESYLEIMLKKFDGGFPTTREFSAWARSTLPDIVACDDADVAIMAWMEREENLFRTLERHLISDRLAEGFKGDVDAFISFSLSVQNRRKSRVGLALENHLEMVFRECGIKCQRTAVTENKSKPDFLFPSSEAYHDPEFDRGHLTVLGVKSTCKDRWRQVLAEANRIEEKHLLTLEAAISTNQTNEMKANRLQLVLPRRLHESYSDEQRGWLLDIKDFIALVKERQECV